MNLYIDFVDIGDSEDFYTQLREKLILPESFNHSTEALLHYISTEVEHPLHIEFINMSVEQLDTFEDLLTALEDTEEEVEGFSFSYYLEQYED